MSLKRTHKKSRLGCRQCKSRRIKCDETPPICGNCAKKGLECDYLEWDPSINNIQLYTPESFSQNDTAGPSRADPQHSKHLDSSEGFSLDDLGLFRHFILYTSQTMDPLDSEPNHHLWRHEVPRIAESHAFVMHAVLGFAAAHQATSDEEQRPKRLQLARHHYSKALTLFQETVTGVTPELAGPLLCFGILISFLTLRLEFEKPQEEQDPIDDFVNLVQILHSSLGVLVHVQESLEASAIGGLLKHTWNKQHHEVPDEVNNSLNQIETLVLQQTANVTSHSSDTITILKTLDKLRRFYTLSVPRPSTWAFLIHWPIALSLDFTLLLQQRNPVALCILAHWCVPAYNAPGKWFLGDWPRRLMLAVAQSLRESDWKECIQWALTETIGECSRGCVSDLVGEHDAFDAVHNS